ncbi:MAG: site-2 protease family protein [Cocleimonas sp.]|nr:site-2 protease family protein [Cocleimonas sp.]
MDFDKIIYNIAVWALPVLFAITLHEVAHGWMANKLGDSTARLMGRLSLNPIKHIDPIGTIALPIILLVLSSPIVFGWAKPVPVDMRNFKNPRGDMAIVALAGPLSNIVMAVLWVIILAITQQFITEPAIAKGFQDMAYAGVIINLVLFTFNLIPIPPLDGGRVLAAVVPAKISDVLDKIEPYGFFILLALVYIGAFQPVIVFVVKTFFGFFGI